MGTIRPWCTPIMSKRFNVSIPDALAERMEPFKNDLSLSALMQDAIERELTRLTMSDADKELRDQFKAAAITAWFKRYPGLGTALAAYADHLFDLARQDGQSDIFLFYRALFFTVKGDEGLEEVFSRRYPDPAKALEGLDTDYFIGEMEEIYEENFVGGFENFVSDKPLLDDNLFDRMWQPDSKTIIACGFTDKFRGFLKYDMNFKKMAFNAVDGRVRKALPEGDIYQYVIDADIPLVQGYRW